MGLSVARSVSRLPTPLRSVDPGRRLIGATGVEGCDNAGVSTPVPRAARSPRWQLGLALLSFLAASFFGARAGADFERWVVTGLWLTVGLIWIVLWRMDVRKQARALVRAQAGDQALGAGPVDAAENPRTDEQRAADEPATGRATD